MMLLLFLFSFFSFSCSKLVDLDQLNDDQCVTTLSEYWYDLHQSSQCRNITTLGTCRLPSCCLMGCYSHSDRDGPLCGSIDHMTNGIKHRYSFGIGQFIERNMDGNYKESHSHCVTYSWGSVVNDINIDNITICGVWWSNETYPCIGERCAKIYTVLGACNIENPEEDPEENEKEDDIVNCSCNNERSRLFIAGTVLISVSIFSILLQFSLWLVQNNDKAVRL